MDESQQGAMRRLLASDAKYVIGIDEVGLGAWAGPLVVAGVIFKKGWGDPKIKDSKQFSSSKKSSALDKRRKVLNEIIRPNEIFSSVEKVSPGELDKVGVGRALAGCMCKVARVCHAFYTDSIIVIDGNKKVDLDFLQADRLIVMPKADTMVPAVSAASILAKVVRDSLMISLAKGFPQYGFDKHMGYGTAVHKKALNAHGLTSIHRKSYSPMSMMVSNGQ